MQQQTQLEEQEAQTALTPQTVPSFIESSQTTELSNTERVGTQAAINKLYMQARSRRKMQLVVAFIPALIALPALAFIVNDILHDRVSYAANILVAATFLALTITYFWSFHLYPRLVARHLSRVKNTLDSLDDMRLLGPLLQALDSETQAKQPDIIAALRRLLPRLQASDAQLLTREQRTCLYRILARHRLNQFYEKAFILDILKALEQIGDKEAVPYVQRVAKWSRDKDIRHEANNCLPFLLQRSEEYKRGSTLLRPADARTSAPDVLLRAAETKDVKPEELLRAGPEQPPLQ